MHPLRIDFLQRRRPASLLGWALMLAGATGMSVAAWDYSQAQDELRAALDRAERQDRGSKVQRVSSAPAVAPALAQAAARAGAALSLPWGRLLRELETQADPQVALLGVEAQGATRTLRVTGEARGMTEVVGYVERLRTSPMALSVVLGTHELRSVEGIEVIRFTVDVDWGAPL
ncbi:MAG: hypothetical protein C4535_00305 [Comamonadaceae bacterium]|nr:MAG: hypothetical protein C4535_00305 [Comamonadaceae bacterium]